MTTTLLLPSGSSVPELPLLFAHRGGRAHAPENTLTAFSGALARGTNALESDVRLTADGHAVLVHNERAGRWPRRRAVAASRRADLPPDVLALEELYAAVGSDFELSLDVKAEAAFGPAALAAADVNAVHRLWACGTLPEVIHWQQINPGAHLVHTTRVARCASPLRQHVDTLAAAGVDALNMPRRDWNAERVRVVHEAGLLAFGWDAHTAARAGQLLDWGCDGVYGDDVDALMAAAAQRANPSARP